VSEGLKKGDAVHCLRCGETMYLVAFDIMPRARLCSLLLRRPDGSEVPHGEKIECPKCKAHWSSISSVTGNTVGALDLPTWPLPTQAR